MEDPIGPLDRIGDRYRPILIPAIGPKTEPKFIIIVSFHNQINTVIFKTPTNAFLSISVWTTCTFLLVAVFSFSVKAS